MNTPPLAKQPAESRRDQPTDEPVEPAPLTPIPVPPLPPSPDDAPPSTLPTAAKPPVPEEPILPDPRPDQAPQLIAMDLPATDRSDAPLPPHAEAADPEAAPKPTSPELPTQPIEVTAQAPVDDRVEPVTEAQKSEAAEKQPPAEPIEKTAEAPDKTQAPIAETPAEHTPPAAPQTADTSDAPVKQADTPDKQEDPAPASLVYDENSVDQPITFDKMTRPRPSAVSKRLGEAGTVRIRIEVDSSGKLVRHQVLEDGGHSRLLAAAITAMKDSTFHPAQREGQSVHSTRIIEYRF